MIWILLSLLIVLFAISTPIAIALGVASTVALVIAGEVPVITIIQRMFTSVDLFPLMAIPFFILAGSLMEVGGISKRLINFASSLVGQMSGGLAAVAVVTSLFFAAISGSSPATVAAIGTILIPAMVARGYQKDFAAAVQSVSGGLGVIIPPSIPIILFGVTAEVSVGKLFIAGILPGLLVSFSLLIMVFLISKKRGYQGTSSSTMREKLFALKDASLALFMPIIILGGIYSGVFTPTEAAVVAVVYAFVVGAFVYRELTFENIIGIFTKSAMTTSIIMIIIANAGVFGWILTRERVPQMVAESFLSISENPIIFLVLVNVLLLFVGMIFETSAAIIILAPILTPIALIVGIDPVHFGIIMVVNLAIGMVTPPVGVNLFVASSIAGTSLEKISRAVLPFVFLLIVDVMIISYIPAISTFLPALLDK